jgi:hypothetical protein
MPHDAAMQELVGYVLLACAASACCDDATACLSFVHDGDTYSVELMQHYEATPEDDAKALYPYDNYRAADRSCGAGLDLDVGSVVRMKAIGSRGSQRSTACECHNETAHADVQGVEERSRTQFALSPGAYYFADQQQVAIGHDCKGFYSIGIMPVHRDFIEHSNQWVASDFMLFRSLGSDDLQACIAPGTPVPSEHLCWDSWAVRIRDPQGQAVSSDLPVKPGQLVLSDAGPLSPDAAM